MDGLIRRRSENLGLGPSATAILAAFDHLMRAFDEAIVVQPPGPGPWTAYYKGQRPLALARPSESGPQGSADIAIPLAGWARNLTRPPDDDDREIREALLRATVAPDDGSGDLWVGGGGGAIGGLFALLALGSMIIVLVSRLIRHRKADTNLAAASGPQAVRILRAARREISIRGSSLSIGCVGATISFFGLGWLIAAVFAGVAPSVVTGVAGWILILGALILSIWLFRWIRRRYPSPPQRRIDRAAGWLLWAIV